TMHDYSSYEDTTIEIKGKPSVVADALSRMPLPTSLEDVERQNEEEEEVEAADEEKSDLQDRKENLVIEAPIPNVDVDIQLVVQFRNSSQYE
ncbi:hypothetical protein KI387_027285, partial [Taxus chinensis]